ncbi:MAG: CDP-glycerol glycerophosphotransferase family protein [bacterium]
MFFELKNLFHFFRLSEKEKEIVFYSEHAGYYPSFEGVLRELDIQSDQKICYITSDINDPILKNNNPKINSFYIKRFLPFFMLLVNCKVFVLTLTDLNQFHLKRSINNVHYVYVFHALVSSHMMYREGAFDHYDTILCVGPHHEKEIRKREKDLNLKSKKLIYGGYYRLERISQNYKNLNFKNTGKNILIAPSWGPQNIIESCGVELVQNLLNLGYKITLRPHPEITRRKPEILKNYFDKFTGHKNFILETNVASDDSMLNADLLITDLSGIALEYSFGTLRPTLFIDLPKKIQNKNYKDLGIEPFEISIREKIGIVIKPEEIKNIDEIAQNLINKKDFYKEEIEKIKQEAIYEFGNSSRVGAKAILDILG